MAIDRHGAGGGVADDAYALALDAGIGANDSAI